MARAKTPQRLHLPDPKYQDVRVTRLIHYLMKDGKKAMATRIVYAAFEIAEKELQTPAMEIFDRAYKAIVPAVEVRSRRMGGANIQVPREVPQARQLPLCFRWLLGATKGRSETTMTARLANEMIAASKGEGNAVKKRAQAHKAAASHKAYSHLR